MVPDYFYEDDSLRPSPRESHIYHIFFIFGIQTMYVVLMKMENVQGNHREKFHTYILYFKQRYPSPLPAHSLSLSIHCDRSR